MTGITFLRDGLFALGLMLLTSAAHAQLAGPPTNSFVVSLAQDSAGCIWAGTEDLGVFRRDSAATGKTQWTNFTTKEGLGDNNAYAICIDKLNRVWVGHLNHGVSVYNGQSWKNYDVLDGPIGERVFGIAADPTTGDVWIATSAGLTRYSIDNDAWTHVTRADGLPADEIQSLAFDAKGTLFAGTQCDGLAIFGGKAAHGKWQHIAGSDSLPLVPTGNGLPSNLINQVLVARDGTVYVATTCGLAASKDHGKSFSFVRGADWADKVKGLAGGPPRGWKPSAAPLLLTEDYCTCLAEDESGNLWIGHRQTGYEVIVPGTLQRAFTSPIAKHDKGKPEHVYVCSILPRAGLAPLVGYYGQGLGEAAFGAASKSAPPRKPVATSESQPSFPKHPSPAAPPTLDELNGLLEQLGKVPVLKQLTPGVVVALPDDWRTQGDWLGRYGRYWACCCAICSPEDYIWGAGPDSVDYYAQIGPHRSKDDSIRYWVHSLYTTNRRSLEMPPTYFDSRVVQGLASRSQTRREAEWDDHGEAYAPTHDGPHVFCTLDIPAGQYYLSLYDFNKDGHEGSNRFRDYRVSIRPHSPNLSLMQFDDFDRQPELAHGRIHDFWGGVWKRFYVQGPTQLTIQIGRNNSHNTILPGVMLDFVDEQPAPYFHTDGEWKKINSDFGARRNALLSESKKDRPARFAPRTTAAEAADALFAELQNMRLTNTPWWAAQCGPYFAALLRWHRESEKPGTPTEKQHRAQLTTCYYQLRLFSEWEDRQRSERLTPARDIEKALRWDGATYTLERAGHRLVSEYLHPPMKNTLLEALAPRTESR